MLLYAIDKFVYASHKTEEDAIMTNDGAIVLVHGTVSSYPVSVYIVSLNYLVQCVRYALDKHYVYKSHKRGR